MLINYVNDCAIKYSNGYAIGHINGDIDYLYLVEIRRMSMMLMILMMLVVILMATFMMIYTRQGRRMIVMIYTYQGRRMIIMIYV